MKKLKKQRRRIFSIYLTISLFLILSNLVNLTKNHALKINSLPTEKNKSDNGKKN